MEPVSNTPTAARHYALLSGTYSSLLAVSALTARDREPIERAELLPMMAATFALSKLLVHEKVETWVRQPFVEEKPDGKRPRGRGLRYAVGELLTCTRCAGAWSALALVSLRLHAPGPARPVLAALTISAGNDFLQSGFSWLCARTTLDQSRASAAEAGEEERDLRASRRAA